MTHILITGGAGFIGSCTARLLLEQGHTVTVLDNLSTGEVRRLPLSHPELQFIEGNVLDYPLFLRLIQSCDAVLHLAAIVSVPFSIAHPAETFQVNVYGFLNVLNAMRETKRRSRLVYASSAAVYGNRTALPCCEEAALSHPLSPYALHKINNEQYAGLHAELYALQALGLRYFNVYGAGQDNRSPYAGVISRFLEAYKQGRTITIFGDGTQSRDFIHVRDVARANHLALTGKYTGVLNIATGHPETLLQLISCIQQVGKAKASTEHQPKCTGDVYASYADITRAEQALGFKSAITLQAGIQQMFND